MTDNRSKNTGSPPLARGKDLGAHDPAKGQRITPACAGKRAWGSMPKHWTGGSPPLARGKVSACDSPFAFLRITPACAGKSAEKVLFTACGQDHPRLRGEKRRKNKNKSIDKGSPPLARGKETAFAKLPNITGITPACAGKSAGNTVNRIVAGDHPRLRGEKPLSALPGNGRAGSPPLARGKGLLIQSHGLGQGITPACAGKRACRSAS